MPTLLTIAYSSFETMNCTLSKIKSCKSQITPIILADDSFLLPPILKQSSSLSSRASTKTPHLIHQSHLRLYLPEKSNADNALKSL
jgi:hypothetical protein